MAERLRHRVSSESDSTEPKRSRLPPLPARLVNLRQEIRSLTPQDLDANLLYIEEVLRSEDNPFIRQLASEKRKYLIYEYFATQILTAFPVIAKEAQSLKEALARKTMSERHYLQSPTYLWQEFIRKQVAIYFREPSDGRRLVKNDPYMMQVIVEEMRGHQLKKRNQSVNDCLGSLAGVAGQNALSTRFLSNFVDSYSLATHKLAKEGQSKRKTPEEKRDGACNYDRRRDWWRALGLMPETVNQEVNQRHASMRDSVKHRSKYQAWQKEQRRLARIFLQDFQESSVWSAVADDTDFFKQPWSSILDNIDEACWQEVSRNTALRQMAVADVRLLLRRQPHFIYQDVGLLLQAVSHYNARYFVFNYCRSQDIIMHRVISAQAADEVEAIYAD